MGRWMISWVGQVLWTLWACIVVAVVDLHSKIFPLELNFFIFMHFWGKFC